MAERGPFCKTAINPGAIVCTGCGATKRYRGCAALFAVCLCLGVGLFLFFLSLDSFAAGDIGWALIAMGGTLISILLLVGSIKLDWREWERKY